MADPVKKLLVQFDADSSKGLAAIKGINDETDKTSGLLGTALGAVTGFVGGTAIIGAVSGAFSFLKDQVGDMVQAGMQANDVMAQTEAHLKSTNDASGMTAKGIEDLATHIMSLTGVDDDTVQSTENLLLTFTNIGQKTFPAATQAAIDLSAGMTAAGHSMSASDAAVQLGKALNDPLTGMTALTKEGITFSNQQKQQIQNFMAANNVAGAQGVILAEVNREFGNSAAAAGQANGGVKILTAQLDNMKQTIGQAIVPVIGDLTTAVSPLVTQLAADLPGAIAAVKPFFQDLATDGKSLWDAVSGLVSAFMTGLKPALDAIGQAIGPIGPSTLALGLALGPMGLIISRAFGLIGPSASQVSVFLKDLSGKLAGLSQYTPEAKALGQAIGQDLVKAFDNLEAIWKIISPYVKQLGDGIGKTLTQAAQALWPQIQQAWKVMQQWDQEMIVKAGPAIKNIEAFIQAAMPVVKAIWNATWPVMQGVLSGFFQVVKGIVEVGWSFVSNTFAFFLDLLGGNTKGAMQDQKNIWSGAWKGIEDIFGGAGKILGSIVQGWWNVIKGYFVGMKNDVTGLGNDIIRGLGNGMGAMAGWLRQQAANLAQDALNAIKGVLGIHSPSKVLADVGQYTSMGFVQGMQGVDVAGAAASHFSGVAPAAAAALGLGGMNSGGSGASAASAGAAFAAQASGAGGGSKRQQVITIEVNGLDLWRAIVPAGVDDIRLKTGALA